jgi:hypothetical protein
MEKSKRARRRKPETAKTNLKPSFSWFLGGQGVWSDPESEGFEEKYRAVINGGHPEDEQVGQRLGQGRARTMGTKALLIHPSYQGVC